MTGLASPSDQSGPSAAPPEFPGAEVAGDRDTAAPEPPPANSVRSRGRRAKRDSSQPAGRDARARGAHGAEEPGGAPTPATRAAVRAASKAGGRGRAQGKSKHGSHAAPPAPPVVTATPAPVLIPQPGGQPGGQPAPPPEFQPQVPAMAAPSDLAEPTRAEVAPRRVARGRRSDDIGAFAPGESPRRARIKPVGEDSDSSASARRAMADDEAFPAVVGWTLLGALLPGAGLIAAGRRRAGWLVLMCFTAVAAGLLAVLLLGDPVARLAALMTDPNNLMVMAGILILILIAWALIVLITYQELCRDVVLTRFHRVLSGVLVLSLVSLVGVPMVKAGSYLMILRDTVTGIFATGSGGSVGQAGAGPLANTKDPWAALPRVNVLLIGSDAGADRTGIRPDTLILASINTVTGDTVLFSLPRNLEKVPFPEGSPMAQQYPEGFDCVDNRGVAACLLNAFWTFGEENWQTYYPDEPTAFDAGLRATADAVTAVTGLSVDQYAMLNLRGFVQFVDAVGGVTVNVYQRLPIGGSSSNPVATGGWIEPGLNQHLDGYHALWYARSRWSTDDYDRMRRQRCVIGAVVEQIDPAKVALAFPQIAAAAKENVITGIPQADLGAWVLLAQRVQKAKVSSLPFTAKVVKPANPDFALIRAMVQHAIDPNAPAPLTSSSPSATVTTPADEASQTQTATSTATSPSEGTPSPSLSVPPQEDGSGTAQELRSVC